MKLSEESLDSRCMVKTVTSFESLSSVCLSVRQTDRQTDVLSISSSLGNDRK